MPGEVYSVTISTGAFVDLLENDFEGLLSGYTISTKPFIQWVQVGAGHFNSGDVYFSGERYGAAVAVDRSNNLFVLGGHNGTAGSSKQLNDEWLLATGREVNCAASMQPIFECTSTGLPPDGSNIPKACTDRGTYAGKSNWLKSIWKAPSAGGQACVTSDGQVRSMVKDVLDQGHRWCPCPKCTSAPPGLSKVHPVDNVIADLTFSADLPITADRGLLNLTCASGSEPSGHFECQVGDILSGAFKTPYPTCLPLDCLTPPKISKDMRMTVATSQCSLDMAPFPHGSVCQYMCEPNFAANTSIPKITAGYDGMFRCHKGNWVLDHPGSCVAPRCNTNGAYKSWQCRETSAGAWRTLSNEPVFGTECQTTCWDKSTYTAVCSVSFENLNGAPEMIITIGVGCPDAKTEKTTTGPSIGTDSNEPMSYVSSSVVLTLTQMVEDLSALSGSLRTGLAAGVRAASPALGAVSADQIMIANIEANSTPLQSPASVPEPTTTVLSTTTTTGTRDGDTPTSAVSTNRLTNTTNNDTNATGNNSSTGTTTSTSPTRRLGPAFRRLQSFNIKVAYKFLIPSALAAVAQSELVANTQIFNKAMAKAYADAEETRTGTRPVVLVFASETVNSEAVLPSTSEPASTSALSAVSSPPLSPPSPSPAPPASDDQDDISTAVVAGVLSGVGACLVLVVICLCVFKKRNKSREAQTNQGRSRSGHFRVVKPEGQTYEGQFVNGQMHGEGTFTWPDGRQYKGQWENDKRHGMGQYTEANGDTWTGRWSNDEPAEANYPIIQL
eukprot:gnl/MRDRNA2_/MRDRNA2_61229_c0_seq2.p1 gnl/MRDRNA2_/MRDRNA2_61229_c0~~gnl/MRDRNA2_/MRDRNA2_61229_c0_seq2.p1  ORF type:complete len:812 (-),score=102.15 gnl/MRDRNA2_/MRDRNA2_61229_c0_seq2:149-2497(-)